MFSKYINQYLVFFQISSDFFRTRLQLDHRHQCTRTLPQVHRGALPLQLRVAQQLLWRRYSEARIRTVPDVHIRSQQFAATGTGTSFSEAETAQVQEGREHRWEQSKLDVGPQHERKAWNEWRAAVRVGRHPVNLRICSSWTHGAGREIGSAVVIYTYVCVRTDKGNLSVRMRIHMGGLHEHLVAYADAEERSRNWGTLEPRNQEAKGLRNEERRNVTVILCCVNTRTVRHPRIQRDQVTGHRSRLRTRVIFFRKV